MRDVQNIGLLLHVCIVYTPFGGKARCRCKLNHASGYGLRVWSAVGVCKIIVKLYPGYGLVVISRAKPCPLFRLTTIYICQSIPLAQFGGVLVCLLHWYSSKVVRVIPRKIRLSGTILTWHVGAVADPGFPEEGVLTLWGGAKVRCGDVLEN